MTDNQLPPCPVCGAGVFESSIYEGDIDTIACEGTHLHPFRQHEFIVDIDEYRALCADVKRGREAREKEGK